MELALVDIGTGLIIELQELLRVASVHIEVIRPDAIASIRIGIRVGLILDVEVNGLSVRPILDLFLIFQVKRELSFLQVLII